MASLKVVNTWILKNHHRELSFMLAPTDLHDCTGDTRELCRHIVIKLFSQHLSNRLQALLHYMNKSVKSGDHPHVIAKAIANLVLWALGLPCNIECYPASRFQYAGTSFTKSLLATSDTLFCDFILYSIIPYAKVDVLLDQQDTVDGKNVMVNNNKTPLLTAFEELIKMPCMTHLLEPSTFQHIQRAFGYPGGLFYGPSRELMDLRYKLMKMLVKDDLSTINVLQHALWSEETRRPLA